MIYLINGTGQLGEALSRSIDSVPISEDIYIYHTWNVEVKEEVEQESEYAKFVAFVNKKKNSKIIFVSTASTTDSWYTHYKQLAESYLLQNCSKGIVIRLPCFIGKGPVANFRDPSVEAFGVMEVVSLQQATDYILSMITYNGLIKCHTLVGDKIPARTIKEIVLKSNV